MYGTTQSEDLRAKNQTTVDDIRDGARRIKEDVRQAAGTFKNDIEDVAREAGAQARACAGSVEKNVKDTLGSVTNKINDNPVQSSVIALGVGVLLGLVFFRR